MAKPNNVKLNPHKIGIVLGAFFAIVHAIWAILIGITPNGVQWFINWVVGLHMINMPMIIMPFRFTSAITLVIVTFVFGYIFGQIFSRVWNWQK